MIDIHTHIFDEKRYKEYFRKAKNRIEKSLVLLWVEDDLTKFINFIGTKKNLYAVGSVNTDKDIQKQLDFCEKLFRENKMFGIKLYPGYQHFYPSDEKIYPIAEMCQKYNKPLIFHSGDVWDPRQSLKCLLKHSHPIHIDELAVKFPQCKIIISHFGFPYILETANIVDKNINVYTDISGTIDEVGNKKEAKKLFSQYVKDIKRELAYFPEIKNKIMFGTDFCGDDTPLHEIDLYIKLIEKVFTKKEQKNAFNDLAAKLFFE